MLVTDNTTGISFPVPFSAADNSALVAVLEAVASCCAKHLRLGGYFSDAEADAHLTAYSAHLRDRPPASHSPMDFLAFTAAAQAKDHSLTVEGEIHRMQKLLLGNLPEGMHSWTFGVLPGRADSLYEHCPAVRSCCLLLHGPAVTAGEPSIVHVASINPVALFVAAAWLEAELTLQSGGEAPFVFPFMVEPSAWATLLERHFSV